MKSWITQLRKGLLEFCVLNVVNQGETYGYEIVQNLKILQELAISEGTVYPILSRLRKEGLLGIRALPSPNGPPRRYFSLTPEGKKRIQEMNHYWDSLMNAIDQIRYS